MKKLSLNLRLFDAAAGAQGAAAVGQGASNGVSNQQQAEKVLYGKQPQEPGAQEPGAGAGAEGSEGQEGVATQEEKQTLKDLISTNPELKNELERMMQSRVKNARAEVDQVSKHVQALDPILTTLYARYGVQDGDLAGLTNALNADSSYLEEEAELKGMTVEQLAYVKQLELKNMIAQRQYKQTQDQMYKQQLQQRWDAESEKVKEIYPDFDFASEVSSNENFAKLIRANFPIKDAYEFAHKEELEQAKQAAVATQMQKQVVSNIKARQERPNEAGLKGQQGFQIKSDPSQYTDKG